MKILENICYGAEKPESQVLDLYLPDNDKFPVVIYFHGGGIIEGDKKEKFLHYLQEKGVAVISANYRMYPEAKYPEFIDDAASVVAWAYKNMTTYGSVQGIFVGGSSAGGYMTQMLCFDKSYLAKHDIDSDKVTGYIMDAGQPTAHFNVLKERGFDHRRVIIDETAPIYHITANRSYAPMLVITAEHDMRNREEQTNLMISTLLHLGCEESKIDRRVMPGYKHVGYVNDISEDGNSVFADLIYSFVSRNI